MFSTMRAHSSISAPPGTRRDGVAVGQALLAGVLLALALGRGPRAESPVLVLPPPSQVDPRLEPQFQAQLTADDVARGIQALAQGQGPGLRPEQLAQLQAPAQVGLEARIEVDRLRQGQRRARAALRDSALALAEALLDRGWTPGQAP